MKHYNLWHSLIFQWSHWFPCVRPWQGQLQNSQNVIPMRIFFFTALIGHLAGCTYCKMNFPLNQQKQPSDIQHRAPAPQIIFKASVQGVAGEKQNLCTSWRKKWGLRLCMQQVIEAVPLSAVNRCSVLISCMAKLFSVTHLPPSWSKCCSHHNNTCVSTIHRLHCWASQRQTINHTGLHTSSCMKTCSYCKRCLWTKRKSVL